MLQLLSEVLHMVFESAVLIASGLAFFLAVLVSRLRVGVVLGLDDG
jgi:hypothetical protein